jgi:hypothetical protein
VGAHDQGHAAAATPLTEKDFLSLADDLIPEDLRDFILRHIDSIAELEALLLLRRNPDETWRAAAAAKRLYISESEASTVLEHLCSVDLVTCGDGNYRFARLSEEQSQLVERLAIVYARHLIPVTNLIHGKPRRLREFSDAFKFRKDRS